MNNVELKPCPFCGGEGNMYLVKKGTKYEEWIVECHSNYCPCQPAAHDMYLTKAETIEAWNRRYEKTCRMNKVLLYDEECIEGIECDECGWNEIHDHCEALPNYCPHCGGKVTH